MLLPAVISSSKGSLSRRYELPAGYIAERGEVEVDVTYKRGGWAGTENGKVTNDAPAGTAFGPKRLSANTNLQPASTAHEIAPAVDYRCFEIEAGGDGGT
jgi:hypothetical protein